MSNQMTDKKEFMSDGEWLDLQIKGYSNNTSLFCNNAQRKNVSFHLKHNEYEEMLLVIEFINARRPEDTRKISVSSVLRILTLNFIDEFYGERPKINHK